MNNNVIQPRKTHDVTLLTTGQLFSPLPHPTHWDKAQGNRIPMDQSVHMEEYSKTRRATIQCNFNKATRFLISVFTDVVDQRNKSFAAVNIRVTYFDV